MSVTWECSCSYTTHRQLPAPDQEDDMFLFPNGRPLPPLVQVPFPLTFSAQSGSSWPSLGTATFFCFPSQQTLTKGLNEQILPPALSPLLSPHCQTTHSPFPSPRSLLLSWVQEPPRCNRVPLPISPSLTCGTICQGLLLPPS